MANEKRLIDANALLQSEIKRCGGIPTIGTGYINETSFRSILEQAPTVDAVEVVHGQWLRLDAHKGMEQFKCSICRSECYVPTCMNEPMYDYCPNCGAKMDGERKADGQT